MKITKLFSFGLIAFAAYTFSACTCDCNKVAATIADKDRMVDDKAATRGANAADMKKMILGSFTEIKRFKSDSKLDAKKIEVFGRLKDISDDKEDAAFVKNVLNTLFGAEKKAQQLDVEFLMSEEPIEDGKFVFSIKANDNKDLHFQMYDEEGFDMVASNQFKVTTGNNYKALNLNDFDSGTYIFKLTDDAGRELVRKVEVAKK
jgi:hypothetical protein